MTAVFGVTVHQDVHKNIAMLRHRKKGDIFYVQGLCLHKMNVLQKIIFKVSRVFHLSYYNHVQNQVSNRINWTMQNMWTISFDNNTYDNELQRLFFDKMARLSERIFNRTQVGPAIQKQLREMVAQESRALISPNVAKTLNEQFIEAQLAIRLGVRPVKPRHGCSETYIIRNIAGENIGVFKTLKNSLSMQAPLLPFRMRNKLLLSLGHGGSLFSHISKKCHVAEEACYEIASMIGSKSIPQTAVVQLDSFRYKRKKVKPQIGSFQLFVPDAEEGKSFLGVDKAYRPLRSSKPSLRKELPADLAEDLIINDVIQGNMDRHAENFLIQLGKRKTPSLVLIDGGMAFSPTHSDSSLERDKMYFWTNAGFAKSRFSPQAKKRIKEIYNNKKQLRYLLFEKYRAHEPRHIASQRADRMVERIEMLYWFACEKDYKISRLRKFKTTKQIQRALRYFFPSQQSNGA